MKRGERIGTATEQPGAKRSKASPKYTLDQIANDKILYQQVMLKREEKETKKSKRKSSTPAVGQPAAPLKPQKRAEPEQEVVQGQESDWLGLLDIILEHSSKFTCNEKIVDFSKIAESSGVQNSSGSQCRKQWKALKDSITASCSKKSHPFYQDFRLEQFPKMKNMKTALKKKYSSVLTETLSEKLPDFFLQKENTENLLKEYGEIIKKKSSVFSLEKSLQNSISLNILNQDSLREISEVKEDIPPKLPLVKLNQFDTISLLKGVLSYGDSNWEKIAQKCGNLSRLPLAALKSEWGRLKVQSNLEIERISKFRQITITRATWIKAYIQKIGTTPLAENSIGQPTASLDIPFISHTDQEITQQLSGEYSKCLQLFHNQIQTYEFVPEKAAEYLQDLPLTEAASEYKEGFKMGNLNGDSTPDILQPIPLKPASSRDAKGSDLLQSPSRRLSMGSLVDNSEGVGLRSSFTAFSKGK